VAGVAAPDGPPVTAGTVFYNFSVGKGDVHTGAQRGRPWRLWLRHARC
jgi:hypothetical protein